jgi:hypothetical protein
MPSTPRDHPRLHAPPISPSLIHLSSRKRIHSLGTSIFQWPLAVYNADFRDILRANGPDAYFFVRFLRMMVKTFLPIWILSWAILLPITSVNTKVGNNSGVSLFIFGNIAPDKQTRYAAQLILVYLFTGTFSLFSTPLSQAHAEL